jgi:hypothetical protein
MVKPTSRSNSLCAIPPVWRQLRPAVTENHQRAFALLAQEDLDSVDWDDPRGLHRFYALFRRFYAAAIVWRRDTWSPHTWSDGWRYDRAADLFRNREQPLRPAAKVRVVRVASSC